jgi:hypothetical protein
MEARVPFAKFAAFRGALFANFGIKGHWKLVDLGWLGEFRISDLTLSMIGFSTRRAASR